MKIEFIIPTYNRPNHLATLLSSLTAQTSLNWTAHVVDDCAIPGTLARVKQFFKDEKRIRWTSLNTRYNDHGHTPRNHGLSQATEKLVCMTGEDNYYTPVFVEEVLAAFTDRVNFVFTDLIHNWGKEYIYMQSLVFWSHIDIGNCIYRTEFAKTLHLDVKNFSADWEFAKEYIQKFGGEIRHIKKPLYVHN